MTREEYERLLQSPYWKGYSYALIKERNFTCHDCGRSFPNERNKLQVHHLAYRDANPWSYDPDELVVLCEECHKKRHGIISDPTPVEEPKASETDNYTRSYSSDYNTSERDVRPQTRSYTTFPPKMKKGRKALLAIFCVLAALLYFGNSNKNKTMQDAHEAIRPSDISLEPDMIKDSLTSDQYKLYDLIWRRFTASQMAAAQYDTVTVDIRNGRYEFRASGSRMTFDGWRKVYKSQSTEGEVNIPEISEEEVLDLVKLITEQKFTQPPSRYTEASLVKEMEEKNIGRPSTYASIISVLITRRYIKRVKKSLQPTKLGFDVIGILQEYFSDIVDVKFTAEMEDKLDEIELGDSDWKSVIADFYKGFSEELKIADREVERIEKEVVLSDEVCEICGRPMAIKEGRFGNFLACTGYPECKNTRPIIKSTGVTCPKCGKDIVEKRGRKSGKVFYGCSGYPECDVSYWDKPTGRMCPECGSMIVESKGKTARFKCSNPECKYKEK